MAISIVMEVHSQWQYQCQFIWSSMSMAISMSMFLTSASMARSIPMFLRCYYQWQFKFQYFLRWNSMALAISITLKDNFNVNGNTINLKKPIINGNGNGEKPLACTKCRKTFTQRCGFKKHESTHTGKKPFACITCENTFKHSWSQCS